MRLVTLEIDDYLYNFFAGAGQTAGGKTAETVMTDTLYKIAGEFSEEIRKQRQDYSEKLFNKQKPRFLRRN